MSWGVFLLLSWQTAFWTGTAITLGLCLLLVLGGLLIYFVSFDLVILVLALLLFVCLHIFISAFHVRGFH